MTMAGARPGVQMPAIDAGLEAFLIAAGLLLVGLIVVVLIYKLTCGKA